MTLRRAAVAVLASSLGLLNTGVASGREGIGNEGRAIQGSAARDAIEFNARDGFERERAWIATDDDPEERLVEYARAVRCGRSSGATSTPLNANCTADVDPTQAVDCGGADPLRPLWRRDRATPTSEWSLWQFVTDWSCPQEALPSFSAEDFRRLPIAPAEVSIQPATPTVLINIPTITMAAAAQQDFTTDLLGYAVEVQAAATSYSWDYGDGSEALTTTSPGHPYPDHDVHHTYTAPGTYTITLTTTWSGQYRIAGTTTWQDVDGTATTVTTAPPITAVERRSALVGGACTSATC